MDMARKPKNAGEDSGVEPTQAARVPALFDEAMVNEVDELKPSGIYAGGKLVTPLSEIIAPTLGPHEFAAICAEAWDAHDYQDERIRFDTLGRKWMFRPGKVREVESVLELTVTRLDVTRTDTISTAVLASDMARDMIADVVRAMSEGVG